MENARSISPVRVEKSRLVQLEVGKLPPSNVAIEQAVIGAMLNGIAGLHEGMGLLNDENVFFKESHNLIFTAIKSLYDLQIGVDLLTVSNKLREMKSLDLAGGDLYLMQLTQMTSSSAHMEYHCRILLQFYMKRRMIISASQLLSKAYDDDADCFDLLNEWAGEINSIEETVLSGKAQISYAEALDQVESRIEFLTEKEPEQITGAHTGFANMDRFTGGWQPGELIIDAARPGMGKTAKMLRCALENAKNGKPVGMISAEMSTYQLVARTVAIDTEFHITQITKKGFEKKDYFVTLGKHKLRMRKYPIYIDDSPSPEIRSVETVARSWKRKYDIKVLIVDYLQLLRDHTKGSQREQEIASITRRLKGLAKELDIPVIALSQLSRKVEETSHKKPSLSHLRESGAIEQDADVVSFLFRAEYYGLNVDDDVLAQGGDTEAIFAKYRGGAPNTVLPLKWIGDKMKLMDPDEYRAHMDTVESMAAGHLPSIHPSNAFDAPVFDGKDETPY